jgi:hypothetical protein
MPMDEHPTAEALDDYAFGRLPFEDQEQIEEHILWCHQCQDELQLTDRIIGLIRATLKHPPAPPAGSSTVH